MPKDLTSAAIHDPTERDLGQDPNIMSGRRTMYCCGFAALASVKSISVRYVCLRRMLQRPCRAAHVRSSPFLSGPRHLGSPGPEPPLRGFPDLVEDSSCGYLGLVLRQEAPIVLGDHLRRVLNGVTSLLVGAGLLQDMRR